MVQGYFTLPEAAQYLGLAPEELRRMAQRNQIRSFQDRGTLRFRIQDIQELARQRGLTSDPDLVLGEPPAPKSGATPRVAPPKSGPRSGPRTPPKTPQPSSAARNKNDVFDFEFDAEDSIDIGREVLDAGPTGSKRGSRAPSPRSGASPKSGAVPKSGAAPKSAARGPGRSGTTPREPVKSGSDSDVKLVADGSELGFSVGSSPTPRVTGESGVRLGESGPRKSKLGGSRPSQLAANSPRPKSQGTPQPVDSGIRLVPMGSDDAALGASNDEIPLGAMPPVSASDSDVRLERAAEPPPSEEAMLLTEEINLDEEIRKQEAALQQQSKTRFKPKSQVKLTPPNSPFELSEHDFDEPSGSQAKSKTHEDSSDFDLTPAAPDEDFSLDLSEDALGGEPGVLSGPASGVNLAKPGDSGISLEEGVGDIDLSLDVNDDVGAPVPNDSSDFELSLADPSEEQPAGAESSEFELSLDDSVGTDGGSDSEFELSLDESEPGDASDSEFELTLDDSSGEMAAATPQVKASGKDIFESDQDLVSLDDSGSEVAELDGDSSDFELALDDSEVISEDESGSQVVALDEEEAIDEGAQTLATADFDLPEEEGEAAGDFGELDVEADADAEADAEPEEEVEREVQVVEKVKLIQPAPWGAMPVVLMLPCVIVMFLVGIMGFEMVQSSNGFRQTGFLTRTFAGLMGMEPKK
jgi:excisionase family DNA binding protein